MLSLRCVRAVAPTVHSIRQSISSIQTQQRSMSLLAPTLLRPRILPPRTSLETSSQEPSSSSFQTTQPATGPSSLLLVRGGKRWTFNPSHRRRKRRHGFLARLNDRNGRKILLRRTLKKRTTLSH